MKFNEKLIELRRKEGLSQEELGYKLNVSRQTISKWELGQTTPEMDKLVEMSKIFNISVDELINESEVKTNVNPIIEDQAIREEKPKNNKVFIIIVIALVIVLMLIGFKIFSAFSAFSFFDKTVNEVTSATEEQGNIFEKIFNMIFNGFNEMDVKQFNATLELYTGSNRGMSLKNLLDEVITSNKTKDRKIIVKYNETETQDTTEIKNLKMGFDDFDNFEVSFEYDQDGYIYEVEIEKYENNNGVDGIIKDVMDDVINQNNEDDNEVYNGVNEFINETMNQFNY